MTDQERQALMLELLAVDGWLDPDGKFGLRKRCAEGTVDGRHWHRTSGFAPNCSGYSPSDRLEDWHNATQALPEVVEISYGWSGVAILRVMDIIKAEGRNLSGLLLALKQMMPKESHE